MTEDEKNEVTAFLKKVEDQFKDALEDLNVRFPEVKIFGFIDVSSSEATAPGTFLCYKRGWVNNPGDWVRISSNYDRGAPELLEKIRQTRIP